MEAMTSQNQVAKLDAAVSQDQNLRSFATCINCPKCHGIGFTHAEQSCNILNCIFACCCSGCWYCHKILKKKDFYCYDTYHYCTSCNNYKVAYSAC